MDPLVRAALLPAAVLPEARVGRRRHRDVAVGRLALAARRQDQVLAALALIHAGRPHILDRCLPGAIDTAGDRAFMEKFGVGPEAVGRDANAPAPINRAARSTVRFMVLLEAPKTWPAGLSN